ncbi:MULTISPECIES: ATP-binding protein [Streptomyces]|uniref:ATP-binding protein n=1 Tax=Streptomyces doebereineriae TaxID=3075528 RepID=A0ABU2VL12_9ACTN|nr:ATP-binding protein [Streptomyces sp. DSM 41640]MDT0486288.1 ATP-binding protein [Streptomyces sp. DSM 41640]
MKQSAAKTLGVAALGAAFAAAGAGAANAAPAVPDATSALGSVSKGLPTETLPGGGAALAQAQPALGAGLATAQPAVEKVLADGPAAPVAGLLGGLPVSELLLGGDSSLSGLPIG